MGEGVREGNVDVARTPGKAAGPRRATSDERRATPDERRATSDERRATSDERRATPDALRLYRLLQRANRPCDRHGRRSQTAVRRAEPPRFAVVTSLVHDRALDARMIGRPREHVH